MFTSPKPKTVYLLEHLRVVGSPNHYKQAQGIVGGITTEDVTVVLLIFSLEDEVEDIKEEP